MGIREGIKNLREYLSRRWNSLFNKTPLIGEGEAPDRINETFAPKGIPQEVSGNSFIDSLKIDPETSYLQEKPVSFEPIPYQQRDVLRNQISEMGGKLDWTHKSSSDVVGKVGTHYFMALARTNDSTAKGIVDQQTICFDNGYCDISTEKGRPEIGSYRESLTQEDGTKTTFEAHLGKKNDSVYYRQSFENGITLIEDAGYATTAFTGKEFGIYAQPSLENEVLEGYANTTGLPIIMDSSERFDKAKEIGSSIKSLTMTMRDVDKESPFPYIISIEAKKETETTSPSMKKTIKYAYSSAKAYRDGEKPYMIYMSGIDGREGTSGMFRLNNDGVYVDNSTFRWENDKFTYDTKSHEEIMALAGKMPTQLSQRAASAIKQGFEMPPEIAKIYKKAIGLETEKETPVQEDPVK